MQSFHEWLLNEEITQINVVHITTPQNAINILKNGFSLKNFGDTARKTKQLQWLKLDPMGIYFVRDEQGNDTSFAPRNPIEHSLRGVRIYATCFFTNPLNIGGFAADKWNKLIDYKQYLFNKYGNIHGKKLTTALMKDGYDGIVTDGEIVAFDPSKIVINREKTNEEWKNLMKVYPPSMYGKGFILPDLDNLTN